MELFQIYNVYYDATGYEAYEPVKWAVVAARDERKAESLLERAIKQGIVRQLPNKEPVPLRILDVQRTQHNSDREGIIFL